MKRLLILMLALLMLCSLAACGKKETGAVRLGLLTDIVASGGTTAFNDHLAEAHGDDLKLNGQPPAVTTYDNLSAMLLALKADNIDRLGINAATAQYIVANNDDLVVGDVVLQQIAYSMVTSKQNTALYDILNSTIAAMKADGSLETLKQTYLNGSTADPAPADMPVTEGAQTYKIAVTGDLPPMDYVTADGKPAGFNVALLSEIAKRNNINLELVVIESGAKATALAAGTVDAYFWIASGRCAEHPDFRNSTPHGDVLCTEDYVIFDMAYVCKK